MKLFCPCSVSGNYELSVYAGMEMDQEAAKRLLALRDTYRAAAQASPGNDAVYYVACWTGDHPDYFSNDTVGDLDETASEQLDEAIENCESGEWFALESQTPQTGFSEDAHMVRLYANDLMFTVILGDIRVETQAITYEQLKAVSLGLNPWEIALSSKSPDLA